MIPKRNGLWSIKTAAYVLCKILGKYAPKLAVWYADNPALLAAVAAAQAACLVLRTEVEKQMPIGT